MPQAIVTKRSGIIGFPFAAVHIFSLKAALSDNNSGFPKSEKTRATKIANVPTSKSALKIG